MRMDRGLASESIHPMSARITIHALYSPLYLCMCTGLRAGSGTVRYGTVRSGKIRYGWSCQESAGLIMRFPIRCHRPTDRAGGREGAKVVRRTWAPEHRPEGGGDALSFPLPLNLPIVSRATRRETKSLYPTLP